MEIERFMKNIEIINAIKVLEKYADMKLPQKIIYAISRNMKFLNDEYKVYQESLGKLFKNYNDYAEKDDKGKIKFDPNSGFPVLIGEKDGEFKEELAELLNIDVEVKKYTINPEIFDYDDAGKYQLLTVHDINVLTNILCDE